MRHISPVTLPGDATADLHAVPLQQIQALLASVDAGFREVLMTDGITNPPEPATTEAGDGWLYADGDVDTAALSNNPFPSVLLADQASTPSTPAAGHVRLFIESGVAKLVDSTGTVTAIGE